MYEKQSFPTLVTIIVVITLGTDFVALMGREMEAIVGLCLFFIHSMISSYNITI